MSQVLHKRPPPAQRRRAMRYWQFRREMRKRYRQVTAMFDEDCKRMRLEGELAKYMLLIKRRMDNEGLPCENRSAIIGKDSWPKQYKAGIRRMVGIDIEWRNGNV